MNPKLPTRAGRHAIVKALLRSCLSTSGAIVAYCYFPLDEPADIGWWLSAALVGLAGLYGWQLNSILHARFPALRAAESLSLSLPLFVLLFAAAYVLIGSGDPDAFTEPLSRLDAVYFTITVLATVGFGDIAAVSETARAVVTLQMIAGLVLLGVVARAFLDAVRTGRANPK